MVLKQGCALAWPESRHFSNPTPTQRRSSRPNVEIEGSYLPGCRLPAPFLTNWFCTALSIMIYPGHELDAAMMYRSSRSVQGMSILVGFTLGWLQAIRWKPSRTQRLKRRLSMEWRFEICKIAGMSGGVVRRRSRYVPPSVSSGEAANLDFRYESDTNDQTCLLPVDRLSSIT